MMKLFLNIFKNVEVVNEVVEEPIPNFDREMVIIEPISDEEDNDEYTN